jgi:hypothetical protein
MSDSVGEFERLLGRAALQLWADLPRDTQEKLFEALFLLMLFSGINRRSFSTNAIHARRIHRSQQDWRDVK